MLKIKCILMLTLFSFACYGSSQIDCEHSIKISKITMDVDQKNDEYSLNINLINEGENIDNWQIGFYMVGSSFHKQHTASRDYNQNLITEICDHNNSCVEIIYQKTKSVTDIDLSQGYVSIFKPNNAYPLQSKKSYTIKLSRNNFWGSGNISYFPQNFFLVVAKGPTGSFADYSIHTIKTDYDVYKLNNYNQEKITREVVQHSSNNWKNSIPYVPTQSKLSIIPEPAEVSFLSKNQYVIPDKVKIHNSLPNCDKEIKVLIKALQDDLGKTAIVNSNLDSNADIIINKSSNSKHLFNNPEGYKLNIGPSQIVIEANSTAGVFYAIQSLRQIWHNSCTLPNVSILDYPRFKYRGVMLDIVRHFFTLEEINHFIEIMAAHKLNTLHLHMADDEGFRIDLIEYPKLKINGSRRGFGLPIGPTMLVQQNLPYNKGKQNTEAKTVYAGAYDEKQIKKLIAFANAHHITVIPEIDLPAHSRALIKALPEHMVDPHDHSIYFSAQGYTDDVLPVCTYHTNISIGHKFTKTIDDIVNKTSSLFNNQTTLYAINNEISIGGDEVSQDAWTNTTSCQKEWSKLSALQKSHKFFQIMSQTNPQLILSGWQQFIQTNNLALGDDIVPNNKSGHVWVWSNEDLGIKQASVLANAGYSTVLAFSDKTYFDLSYTIDINEPGLNWASKWGDTHSALSIARSAEQTIQDTSYNARQHIVGLEGALWSETIATFEQLIYMSLPKMAGLAEAAWSPSSLTVKNDKINWQNLAYRLGNGKKGFLAYLNKIYKVEYRGYPNGIRSEAPEVR